MSKKTGVYNLHVLASYLKQNCSRKYEQLIEYSRFNVVNKQEFNDCIASRIRQGGSFLAGKIGGTELKACVRYLGFRLWQYYFRRLSFDDELERFSGIFPSTDTSYADFVKSFTNAIRQVDLLGVWFKPGESNLISSFIPPHAIIGRLRGLEPYHISVRPWSRELAGKRVLICSPFSNTIKQQIPNLKKIWLKYKTSVGIELIPDCEFEIVKAPYGFTKETQAKYISWENVIDGLSREIFKKRFDIAIVGCGGIGLILSAMIKQKGYPVIHMGGPLQYLFGIYGRRWVLNNWGKKYINEYWVRPLQEDRPSTGGSGEYW
jgi:hypothetical protein